MSFSLSGENTLCWDKAGGSGSLSSWTFIFSCSTTNSYTYSHAQDTCASYLYVEAGENAAKHFIVLKSHWLRASPEYMNKIIIGDKNMVERVPVKGGHTPPTQFFVDGCYARLLLLYTYRGFSTTTQGQSTCRRRRSLIIERIWRKYRGLVVNLCSTFLEQCGKLELRNLVHY